MVNVTMFVILLCVIGMVGTVTLEGMGAVEVQAPLCPAHHQALQCLSVVLVLPHHPTMEEIVTLVSLAPQPASIKLSLPSVHRAAPWIG